MKNIFKNFDIKKSSLPQLEKYADILFSLAFTAMIVYLGLIFYNQFLPIYNFGVFDSPNIVSENKIKEEKLNEIIKDLDERKKFIAPAGPDKSIKDPFMVSK